MEYEENQVNLANRAVAEKVHNLDSGTKSLTQITNSLMLKKTSDHQDDVSCNEKMDNAAELSNAIPQHVHGTELSVDELLDQLLEILDDSILEAVDSASTDSFLLSNEDDDYDYVVCDQMGLNKEVNVTKDLTVEENHHNDNGSQIEAKQIEAKSNNFKIEVTKKKSEKRNELNEFTESFVIVLMLFSLYFLLSSMI